MQKKLPKFVVEKDLYIVRKQLEVAVENENVALHEYRFCMSHPKGQKSVMGYDLLELSTGKTLKNVRNIDRVKIWRQSFTSFRNYSAKECALEKHLSHMTDYLAKTHNELGDEITMHWTKELISLENKINEAELKLFEKSIKKFSQEKNM